ncbi:MAG: hypothetical protein Tsb0020_16430 [Haliangiales bacterium]
MSSIRQTSFLALILLAVSANASADPVTIPEPVAPPLADDGYGLCSASAVSEDPQGDFGALDTNTYIGAINGFIEAREDERVEFVIRTELDLSNNNTSGAIQPSLGDFRDVNPELCLTGGCGFFVNDDRTSFATRMRGFFNVTADLVDQPVHFGIYADDAVSLTIFDKSGTGYPVLVLSPILGAPTWRLTETVTFRQPGLYPVEVLYVEVVEHAAFEMSFYVGSFADFQRPASDAPVVNLDEADFKIFEPLHFHQAISGNPSFPDPDQCQQCNRQFAGIPTGSGCPGGYYCNEAALCAPCDTALYCGPSCSPCGADAPFCENLNGEYQCIQCRGTEDCPTGSECDPETNTCQEYECTEDEDCLRGEICVDRLCVVCDTSSQCAGNSCNCCPSGENGQQMSCLPLGADEAPVCVECTANADCSDGVCDLSTGQCVDSLLPNHRPECCGDNCVACPDDAPYCLASQIGGAACGECRSDMDCADGNFCMSGQCLPCVYDKHCGVRCESCGGDQPFCLNGFDAERSSCVGCVDDAQCGAGETCNLDTYQCEPESCAMSCGGETPYCHGGACVACYADTQCPCGGTCDLESFTCSSSCVNNLDCLGTEHCRWDDAGEARECVPGRMPANSNPCKSAAGLQPSKSASGAAAPERPSAFTKQTALASPPCEKLVNRTSCEVRVGASEGSAPWLLSLAMLGLWGWRRRRRREGRPG